MNKLSTFPNLLRGAIVGIDPYNPLASVILFQYNPSQVSRSLSPQTSTEGSDRSEALRLKGAPVETINLEVEIDASDQLEIGDQQAVSLGIYPQLSALEMLLYPKSLQVIVNTALLAVGTMETLPDVAPLTLLIWGAKRVLPVRITSFSITEEAHDIKLNPIRAKVSLGLQVLSYNDLSPSNPGYHLFLANQVIKETMATLGSINNLNSVLGSGVSIF